MRFFIILFTLSLFIFIPTQINAEEKLPEINIVKQGTPDIETILFASTYHKYLKRTPQEVCVRTTAERYRNLLIGITEQAGKYKRGEYWLRIKIPACYWERNSCTTENVRQDYYVFDIYADYDC
jgi:hypothetical protein